MARMLQILYQLPRTIVLLLEPQDFTDYQRVTNRDFLCNFWLTTE